MAITSKDLAKLLNVSPSTISMVLNNRPGISDTMRQLIISEAEKRGMSVKSRRNAATSSSFIHFVIYKKHGKVIGDTPFFSQLIEGIQTETKKHGFSLQVTYYYEDQDSIEQLKSIRSSDSNGMIILATEMNSDNLDLFISLGLPIIILDAYFERKNFDTVVINNVQGAFNATRHLISLGHQKIGYLRSKIRIKNFLEREEGFIKGLGHNKSHSSILDLEPTAEGAYTDMKVFLEKPGQLPTAFFADNDIIAVSCMRALKEKGYRLPDDVSIIGFDDMLPLSEIIDPPLTTMRVPKQSLGMLAVDRLVQNIKGETKEIIKVEVSTELIERLSVKKIH